jgi:hypothetical protein
MSLHDNLYGYLCLWVCLYGISECLSVVSVYPASLEVCLPCFSVVLRLRSALKMVTAFVSTRMVVSPGVVQDAGHGAPLAAAL